MAGVAGFEPTVRESKSRALTSWRHPNDNPRGFDENGVSGGARTHDLQSHNLAL